MNSGISAQNAILTAGTWRLTFFAIPYTPGTKYDIVNADECGKLDSLMQNMPQYAVKVPKRYWIYAEQWMYRSSPFRTFLTICSINFHDILISCMNPKLVDISVVLLWASGLDSCINISFMSHDLQFTWPLETGNLYTNHTLFDEPFKPQMMHF